MGEQTIISSNKRCPICGSYSTHKSEECDYLANMKHVPNKKVVPKAYLSLPDELKIETLADGSNEVKTKNIIKQGTCFGPLEAKRSFSLSPEIIFALKLFPQQEEEFLEYFLDTTDDKECTWMMFVKPADNSEEQNMICYQDQNDIYYMTIKDINQNECLKVWYSPFYAEKMGKQVLSKPQEKKIEAVPPDLNKLIKDQQKILDRENWRCKFCEKTMGDVSKFAQHIMQHYKYQLRKICEICKSSFGSGKSLQKHMRVVHKSPKKKLTSADCSELISNQNNFKELSIGGPLLNNVIDTCDNSNLLMPTLSHLEDVQNMEDDNLNLDNLIGENVRTLDHFNFEIGDNQDEFVCDICVKTFSKVRYLVIHLKRHTGEHICLTCKKIFSRKEVLLNHGCQKPADNICPFCDRSFRQKKFLKRHIEGVHNIKFKCKSCDHVYSTRFELSRHNCKAQLNINASYSCTICRKTFLKRNYLKRHVSRSHPSNNSRMFMCEICCKQYLNKHSYKLHMQTHKDPSYQCEICQKSFYRKDVYQIHLKTHNDVNELECDICNKKFNLLKSLYIHKNTHRESKFKCSSCDATFKTSCNLKRHIKRSHTESTRKTDLTSFYECPCCGKKMKLRSSLVRHVSRYHAGAVNLPQTDAKAAKNTKEKNPEPVSSPDMRNNELLRKELDLMMSSKDNIDSMDAPDLNELESNLNNIKIIDNILLNTTEAMGLGLNDDILGLNSLNMNSIEGKENESAKNGCVERQISLSMPDLTEHNQDDTLGENSYVLERDDNHLGEQRGLQNLVVYVLNQSEL